MATIYLLQASAGISAREPHDPLAHKGCRSDHDLSLEAIEWHGCNFLVGTASVISSIERVSKNHYKFSGGFHTVPSRHTVASIINLYHVPSSENVSVRLKAP